MLWLFVGSIKLLPDPDSGECFQRRMQVKTVNLKSMDYPQIVGTSSCNICPNFDDSLINLFNKYKKLKIHVNDKKNSTKINMFIILFSNLNKL